MSTPSSSGRRDLLAGVERIIVDGSNVLGVLARDAPAAPPGTLVGRIRAAVPAAVRIDLVFDGPAAGSPSGRVAERMSVRYAGRRSGDAVIVELAATAALAGRPPGSNVLVVTDDRALAGQLRRHGASTIGTGWLLTRLERPGRAGAGGVASSRPPGTSATGSGSGAGATAPASPGQDDPRDRQAVADARRWRPGRGATAKTGNARKAPRTARSIEGRPWKRRRRSPE